MMKSLKNVILREVFKTQKTFFLFNPLSLCYLMEELFIWPVFPLEKVKNFTTSKHFPHKGWNFFFFFNFTQNKCATDLQSVAKFVWSLHKNLFSYFCHCWISSLKDCSLHRNVGSPFCPQNLNKIVLKGEVFKNRSISIRIFSIFSTLKPS